MDQNGVFRFKTVGITQVVHDCVGLHEPAAVCYLQHWHLSVLKESLSFIVVELLARVIIGKSDVFVGDAGFVERHSDRFTDCIAIKVVELYLVLGLNFLFAFNRGAFLTFDYLFGGLLDLLLFF